MNAGPVEHLSPDARRIALAVARAALPAGDRFAEADERTVDRTERLLSGFGRGTVARWGSLLHVIEHAARITHRGRSFSSLPRTEAETMLVHWATGDVDVSRRTLALALTAPMKIAYFDDPKIYADLKSKWRFTSLVTESPRWMRQVIDGDSLTEDTDVECDAVVIGTGAGGAVVACELARKGLAVLLLEEGRYHTRVDFDGRGIDNIRRFYRGKGTVGTVGNTFIPLPMGRLVGGSTAINTGTCWRTPEWVLERWAEEEGLRDLAPDRMAPYFERVEKELEVAPSPWSVLGGVARVVSRGCDALGYSHRALARNAPGCDGSGICDYGCPTDARRSTNVSYVPSALGAGAQLFTGVRAARILRESGRVVGVEGVACGSSASPEGDRTETRTTGKRVRVRARATIVACGTVMSPLLLGGDAGARRLPWLGRNLSIHPATTVSALFDEEIRGYAAVPQGYCVDEFRREGILLMGASAPVDMAASTFGFVGRDLVRLMEAYDKVASFGVMVDDETRGRVTRGPGGRPLILYRVGRVERERLRRGTEIMARIYLAAGAREVYPALHGHRVIRDARDIARLASTLPAASDWLLSAFHPLGTCRMAMDPTRGVVSTDHEVFGAPGLYVSDGSVVPSSVGVNPQETIMALSTRAAERIARRLES
ncbi:MAG TPA: GMC family oxidoreductase [Polyangiaceae bacterium]|nr:GMC family oxidoreductase [Polyangiaceae bacterium]